MFNKQSIRLKPSFESYLINFYHYIVYRLEWRHVQKQVIKNYTVKVRSEEEYLLTATFYLLTLLALTTDDWFTLVQMTIPDPSWHNHNIFLRNLKFKMDIQKECKSLEHNCFLAALDRAGPWFPYSEFPRGNLFYTSILNSEKYPSILLKFLLDKQAGV